MSRAAASIAAAIAAGAAAGAVQPSPAPPGVAARADLAYLQRFRAPKCGGSQNHRRITAGHRFAAQRAQDLRRCA